MRPCDISLILAPARPLAVACHPQPSPTRASVTSIYQGDTYKHSQQNLSLKTKLARLKGNLA